MGSDEAARIMKVARHYAETHRRDPGKRLTPATLRVLETFLFKAMDWATGKIDWSYAQLAERAGRCIDSVWRAILQLEAGGWLERMRRCEPNPGAGPGDAPFIQITNAYRIQLPDAVRRWWQSVGISRRRKAPVPDDIAHDQAVRAGEKSIMEPQNHKLIGEREIERRQAQREASLANAVHAVKPVGPGRHQVAPQATPRPERNAQDEMRARLRAVVDAMDLRGSADSGNQ